MKEILDHFFHRHTFDPTKWEIVGSVNLFEPEEDLTTWLYTYGTKQKERKIIAIRRTYTNTCLKCGTLLTKQVEL